MIMFDLEHFVIVFDVDGTLFDTKPGIIKAFKQVLNYYKLAPLAKAQEDNIIGPPIKQSFQTLYNMDEQTAEEATSLYRKEYLDKYIDESKPYDNLFFVLKTLKNRGAKVAIATMKTKNQINQLLQLFKLENLFDIVEAASENGNLTKSKMLNYIKNKYMVEKNYVMVGDTWLDKEAAEQNNYIFIAANYGYGIFKKNDGYYIADSFIDLLKIINDIKL